MKKVVSMMMAAVLALAFGLVSMAAPSPAAMPTVEKVMIDGVEGDASCTQIGEYEVPENFDLAEVDETLKDMTIFQAVDIQSDLEFEEMDLSLNVPGIKADDTVKLIQQDTETEEWALIEDEKVTVEDDTIEVTLEKAGPLMVLVEA